MHLRIFAIILCCFRGRKEEKNIMSYCFYNNKVHFHMHNLYRVEKENSEKSFFVVVLLLVFAYMNCFGGEALGFVLKDEDIIHLLLSGHHLSQISIDLLSNQIVKTE
eukprot:09517.XXX_209572_209892_1 [CDS] Oithona nana genome sequencing.